MKDSPSLGDTIRDRRLALGYSLGQLATKVNKTASSIRAWERSDSVPTDEEANELAAALDLDVARLISLRTAAEMVWESQEVEELDVHDPWPHGEAPGDVESATPDEGVEGIAGGVEETQEPSAAVLISDDAETDVTPEDDAPELGESGSAAIEAKAVTEQAEAPGDIGVDGPVAESTVAKNIGGLEELFEAKTEAVPVVPPKTVAVAATGTDPTLTATSAQPIEQRSDNPVVAAWDDLRALYYRIFDPRRRWIYRVRFVLILIAFFIMLRVLAWAAGNLWDAIGEVLDSISFSPGDTPDVEN